MIKLFWTDSFSKDPNTVAESGKLPTEKKSLGKLLVEKNHVEKRFPKKYNLLSFDLIGSPNSAVDNLHLLFILSRTRNTVK